MGSKPRAVPAQLSAAERLVKDTGDAQELRRALAVLLPAHHGLTLAETGRAIGRSAASVARLRAEFAQGLKSPGRPPPQRGGRRRQNMSLAEEVAFVAPFLAEAQRAGVLAVAPFKAAYEQAIGRTVPDSTVYRLLARQGWRKIGRRPRRSTASPERPVASKKISPGRR